MRTGILMVTAIAGAENCAAVLSKQFGMPVETAASRREALAALRRREFAIVVIDEALIDSRADGSDLLLRHAGLAIPLEMNFAISGCGRLVREVRAALSRREREHELALSAAATSIESELRETVAGLLLQTQLALEEPGASPQLSDRLRLILNLALSLRQKLDSQAPESLEQGKTAKPTLPETPRVQRQPPPSAAAIFA
jgi:DNA-binding NtrC family response regulator